MYVEKNKTGRGRTSMRISHTRPAPFNILNGTGMGIVFNKRGGVGMGATRPEPPWMTSPKLINLQDKLTRVIWQDRSSRYQTHGAQKSNIIMLVSTYEKQNPR